MSLDEAIVQPAPPLTRLGHGEKRPEAPDDALLRYAYEVGLVSRCLEEHIVRLAARGDVKFAIWGPGEEVHGTATALALAQVVGPERFGLVPHYRSCSLVSMWAALHGHVDLQRAILRQQFSKDSDQMSRGRQMVNHLVLPELGILPVQSPVGMQLGKAAGYALGFKKQGIHDAVVMSILGDGSTAEGDMHDAMNAASVWQLPLIILVTDNAIAISTTPSEGRGIKSFKSYAEGFGIRHFSCDGRDFMDTWRTTLEAAQYVRDEQKPVLMHAHSLPRFNGHSSAADMSFDLSQEDPLIAFGEQLLARGLVEEAELLQRLEGAKGRDFFNLHRLGTIMEQRDQHIQQLFTEVRAEPEPPLDSIFEKLHAPFPEVEERSPSSSTTQVTYAGAIRSALAELLNQKALILGQDVAKLGGVMQATAGLLRQHPDKIFDAPLNEPLIVGTAVGLGLHPELQALPEIQFGDYSLNAFHWLVHMGNLYWTTHGMSNSSVVLRMPVDPFGGGAVYHSMSVDGYFTPIPGLVIVMPSTSWDAYGLLMTAGEYEGPVVCLEPKWMYRQSLGPALPGEPEDPEAISALRKGLMRGEIPQLDSSLRVPFGKAARRRAGDDLTIVAWGRAVWTAMDAAEQLAAEGVSCDVLDLRTLVPPDLDTIQESAERTGRLIVAAEDRSFAGYVRTIQGHMVERVPGLPSRALGQKNIPGIAQNLNLEHATVLNADQIREAAQELMSQSLQASTGWSWVPPRYFVS